ncbi:protein dj-1beta-like [Homalodisca vitripennis]|uniref:protein dj-1beta-like n=1 Tax=Homalodisca vitripennis TaxID=197043 RepID=UPI001EECB14F|nr:protein dj-1beta-like [Homalodisca vitripennis]
MAAVTLPLSYNLINRISRFHHCTSILRGSVIKTGSGSKSNCFINSIHSKYYCGTKMKSALVLIVDGSEEMEFTISADVLRRAGVAVTVAGVEGSNPVKCSRDVVIVPDTSLAEAVKKGPYDALVLPGGAGYVKFSASAEVGNALKEQEKAGRIVAAICAAPAVLKAHGIAKGKSLTSYPSVKEELVSDYKYSEDKVVIDGNLVTSRGPGTAFDFALALAEKLTDKENAEKVKKAMLL